MSIHSTHKFRHLRDGRVIWASGVGDVDVPVAYEAGLVDAQPWSDNALLDEGEQWMLDTFFRAAVAPTTFAFALLTSAPAETATMATMAEVTGGGYARVAVARNTTDWPTLALASGDYQVTSLQKTFGPLTGTNYSAAVTHLAVVTATTGTVGKLVAAVALSTARTLVVGDSLNVTYSLKLS